MARQTPVVICYEATRPDGVVWAVKYGRQWHTTQAIELRGLTLATVYNGPTARQPRAYLKGLANGIAVLPTSIILY